MLSNKAQLALMDIRDNILAAKRFTDVYAVTRALEIVSEAARRLPASFRERHASLPWKQIMGIGNVLRHNYENVVETIIWETTHTHLAPLLAVVVAEIEAFDGEP